MSELARERGFTPASKISFDLAQVEQANTQWGRALGRLRLLEKEMAETFRDLAEAERSQVQAGNGVGEPAMTRVARAAWREFRISQRAPEEVAPWEHGEQGVRPPPILDWHDPA